jgi:hypothetical protein
MTVVPFPAGRWTWESARGSSRAVRVSPHADAGLLAVSFWREDRCAGSVHLTPEEAASLVGRLSAALAGMAQQRGAEEVGGESVEERLVSVEQRLRALEGTPEPSA